MHPICTWPNNWNLSRISLPWCSSFSPARTDRPNRSQWSARSELQKCQESKTRELPQGWHPHICDDSLWRYFLARNQAKAIWGWPKMEFAKIPWLMTSFSPFEHVKIAKTWVNVDVNSPILHKPKWQHENLKETPPAHLIIHDYPLSTSITSYNQWHYTRQSNMAIPLGNLQRRLRRGVVEQKVLELHVAVGKPAAQAPPQKCFRSIGNQELWLHLPEPNSSG